MILYTTMIERTPVDVPKPCYAVEHEADDPLCQSCDFRERCVKDMGYRSTRVTLDKAKFQIIPERFMLSDDPIDDPDEVNLAELYQTSYETVFGERTHRNVERYPGAKQKLIRAAREVKCSLRLFILTAMMNHQKCHPETEFYPNMLLGDAAIHIVDRWKQACSKRYGTFDCTAIDTLMDAKTAEKDLGKIMLQSEVEAGTYIAGYKKWKSGQPYEALYRVKERALHPYWLAIEPTYFDHVLKSHLQKPFGSKEENRFRHDVAQTVAHLKRHKAKAATLFQARQRILPEAVRSVVSHFGHNVKEFEVEPKPFTNSLVFWSRFGLALQHLMCLKIVDGDDSELTRYGGTI